MFALMCSVGQTPITVAAGPVVASAGRARQQLAQAQGQPSTMGVKPRVQLMGVGAAVEMTLASGSKLRGSIGAIEADRFEVISPRQGAPSRRVAYDEVSELKLAKSTYRSSGAPNVEQVRRVVVGLGVGRHVAVKVTSGETFRGDLDGMTADHFVLLLDREARPMPIAYNDVQNLGPNLSNTTKTVMVAAAVAASVALLVHLASGNPY